MPSKAKATLLGVAEAASSSAGPGKRRRLNRRTTDEAVNRAIPLCMYGRHEVKGGNLAADIVGDESKTYSDEDAEGPWAYAVGEGNLLSGTHGAGFNYCKLLGESDERSELHVTGGCFYKKRKYQQLSIEGCEGYESRAERNDFFVTDWGYHEPFGGTARNAMCRAPRATTATKSC